ncbi:hypothetical protein [Advenella sp. FME57]|uniref:Uncharacterized protein n=1 Tax=Advenella kashmirensis TaxID=310575 RepID=A0A356LBC2_9BURK|nr:hypothetical protein [Advenella sp. FME57]HBP28286.1 hypothetical protein [Advenella kashmirensis]
MIAYDYAHDRVYHQPDAGGWWARRTGADLPCRLSQKKQARDERQRSRSPVHTRQLPDGTDLVNFPVSGALVSHAGASSGAVQTVWKTLI